MPDVIKIVEENFKNIAPSLLLDPKWYQDVEDMVVSIDATTDPDYAKQYALLLAEKLESLGDSISPELFARYTKLLRALRFYSLLAVSDGEKEKFVREQILDVFELEFINVRHWVETMLCAYLEAPDVIDQLRKIFQRGLESNIQTLGTGRLRLAGEQNSVAPTIKNWVSDYNHTARIDELRKSRGSFEEFNYVNQSANAKTLDPKDRKVLQKFLAIYDWLRFAAIKCDYSFPGQKPIPGSDKILEEARYDLIPQEAVDSLKASAAVSPTYLREERITVPVPGTARPPIRPQPHPVAPTPFAPAMPRPAVSPQPSKILPPPPLPPRKVMEGAAPFVDKNAVTLSASKGIENETLLTMSQVLRQALGNALPLAVLSGPSFAQEVARGHPTAVSVASEREDIAEGLQHILSTRRFRVYASDDVIGLELGGSLKNVIAIAAGISDGLGFGTNTRAALITRGLAEISRLAVKMGGNPLTLAGLGGMGDLVLTCTGDLSRNRHVGLKLGQGVTLSEILGDMRMVAEGIKTAESAYALAEKQGVEMPIINAVYAILYQGKTPKDAVFELMTRDLKHELDGYGKP